MAAYGRAELVEWPHIVTSCFAKSYQLHSPCPTPARWHWSIPEMALVIWPRVYKIPSPSTSAMLGTIFLTHSHIQTLILKCTFMKAGSFCISKKVTMDHLIHLFHKGSWDLLGPGHTVWAQCGPGSCSHGRGKWDALRLRWGLWKSIRGDVI